MIHQNFGFYLVTQYFLTNKFVYHLYLIFFFSLNSLARLPIPRGVKARQLKCSAVHRRSVLISDEENTSEYSHSPSSQHSTLESNPELPQTIKRMNKRPINDDTDRTDSSDSDSEQTTMKMNACMYPKKTETCV